MILHDGVVLFMRGARGRRGGPPRVVAAALIGRHMQGTAKSRVIVLVSTQGRHLRLAPLTEPISRHPPTDSASS